MAISTLQQYQRAFLAGQRDKVVGLSGRALRGRKGHPEDFEFLTEQKDVKGRRIIFLISEQGLENCPGLTGWEMFIHPDGVGYDADYLVNLIDKGYEFKMAVFGADSAAKAATWDNFLPMLCEMYNDPRAVAAFKRHWHEVTNTHLSVYERQAGFVFKDVEKLADKKADPRFMTWERFLQSPMTALDVRALLYYEAGHLRENFSGDGFTWTGRTDYPMRQKGPSEFLAPNNRLVDCGEFILMDVDVRKPAVVNVAPVQSSVSVTPVPTKGTSPMNSNVQIASHWKLDYEPRFWDPAKAYQNYVPDITTAMLEGIEYAIKHKLAPAQKLIKAGIANAAHLTDLQQDFRDPGFGRLPVVGTNDVVLRTCARLINGTVEDWYSGLFYSLDGHGPIHISFSSYHRGIDGMPIDLRVRKAACLTLNDPTGQADRDKCVFRCYGFGAGGTLEELGYVQPAFDPRDAVDYWDHLQATGQGDIWIFVDHCVLGTDGAMLHPLLVETIAFMCGARQFQPTIIHKGHISNTDWFGPLQPCRPMAGHAQGGFQKGIVDDFKKFKTIDFVGVAEDFCDFNMKLQTIDNLSGTEYFEKLQFVMDGTAPIVPNAPQVIKLNARARQLGVKFIKHDTPFGQTVSV